MAKPTLVLQLQGADATGDDQIVIDRSPFTVGRDRRMDAYVPAREVSAKHARFEYAQDAWWVTDLDSTNGTYVNANKMQPHVPNRLTDGDFVSLSKRMYRAVARNDGPAPDSRQGLTIDGIDSEVIRDTMELIQILGEQRTFPHFQPIQELATRKTVGYEALGRAVSFSGPIPILKLFMLATQQGRETELSLTLRDSAQQCGECHFCWPREPSYFFFNLHPSEIYDEGRFLHSLNTFSQAADLRKWFQPVVEMPESWVSNVEQMRRVVDQIRSFDMLVAYDDYGQGQARLEDLVQIPPDFVKLDRRLIVDLGSARRMYKIVQAVVDTCHEMEVKTLGEGIETEDELNACLELNIDLGQGYLFKRPMPAYQLFNADPTDKPPGHPQCPFIRLNLLTKV